MTGQRYFTPRFTEKVSHEDNYVITRRVTRAVYEELQVRYIILAYMQHILTVLVPQDRTDAPSELVDPWFHWNEKTLFGFAKTCWRGFKHEYEAQHDDEVAARVEHNRRMNRWKERRRVVRS